MYFKIELCVTAAKLQLVLNKFDSTSPTSTCEHPGFNVTCWTTNIKICGVDGPKAPPNIAELTLRILVPLIMILFMILFMI